METLKMLRNGSRCRAVSLFFLVLLLGTGVFLFTSCDVLFQLGPAGFLQQLSNYGVNPSLDNYMEIDADVRYMASYAGNLYVFGYDGVFQIDEETFEINSVYPVPDALDFGNLNYNNTRGRWYVDYDATLVNTFIRNLRTLDGIQLQIGTPGLDTMTPVGIISSTFFGRRTDNAIGWEFGYDSTWGNYFETADSVPTVQQRFFPAGTELINLEWNPDDENLYAFFLNSDEPSLYIGRIPLADFGLNVPDYPYGYEDTQIILPTIDTDNDESIWARTDGIGHVAVFVNYTIHVYTADGKLIYQERLEEDGTAELSSDGQYLFVLRNVDNSDEPTVLKKFRLVQ